MKSHGNFLIKQKREGEDNPPFWTFYQSSKRENNMMAQQT